MQGTFLLLIKNFMYKPMDQKASLFEMQNEVIKYWKENKTFEKSIQDRDSNNAYLFYDGPPFINGDPHYGHLLASIAKDLIPRYQTMKGKRVRRVWGWDCHGLPMENKVEKKLNLKGKKEIENYGIDKFIAQCFSFANDVSNEWEWYVDEIGRWVDYNNAYKTMDKDFMESIFWAFKQVYDKGHVYEGKRTSLYSTDASSPVSNFEVAMDSLYQDVTDLSCMVSFKLKSKSTYLIAWTTTPWTLTANTAVAVNPSENYTEFEYLDRKYIVAQKRLDYTLEKAQINKDEIKILSTFKGESLDRLSYEPLYSFFESNGNDNDFKVYLSDYVTIEDGTGILHVAPGFGEEDFNIGKAHDLSTAMVIDDEGKMLSFVNPWEGMYLRDVTPLVVAELGERGLLFASFEFTHALPFYRYANPLIYKTQDAWYINIQNIKDNLLKSNENINWIPDHLKEGRFKKGIETAPDWCISRNRFWGTPIPVWKGVDDDGHIISKVIGSFDELRSFSVDPITKITFTTISREGAIDFKDYSSMDMLLSKYDGQEVIVYIDDKNLIPIIMDYEKASEVQSLAKVSNYQNGKSHFYVFGRPLELHRPNIDLIQLKDLETGTILTRIPEVLDCWFESGSMPFAQMHYPFENKDEFESSYPADYICEYIGQTRAWFYVLHVMANLLKESFVELGMKNLEGNSFKNVICTGIIFGNDGKKMSKSLKNYPDPRKTIEKYGSESLRYAFMVSPLMSGANINVDDKLLEDTVKTIINPYHNIYKYFLIYANQFNWDNSKYNPSSDLLDVWIRVRLQKFINDVDLGLSSYEIPSAMREIQPMLEDISTWFIRRSRDRFASGSVEAISTLYEVLSIFSKVVAPILPFTSENIYQNLRTSDNLESIHLEMFPNLKEQSLDEVKILTEMESVRELAKIGLEMRDSAKIKLRQPLTSFRINKELSEQFQQVLKEELNVESVVVDLTSAIYLDTVMTPELETKGNFREVTRAIQDLRKKSGMKLGEKVVVTWNCEGKLSEVFRKMEIELKSAVLIESLVKDDSLDKTLTLNGDSIGLLVTH